MKTISKVACSLALAVSCGGFVGFVQADGCTNAMIKGEYGFQDKGDRKTEKGTVSYDAVRTAYFDGMGATHGQGFVTIDGAVKEYKVTGTYTVNDNCTFTLDATQEYMDGSASNEYKQFGVVIRGGKELIELQTSGTRNQSGKYQLVDSY